MHVDGRPTVQLQGSFSDISLPAGGHAVSVVSSPGPALLGSETFRNISGTSAPALLIASSCAPSVVDSVFDTCSARHAAGAVSVMDSFDLSATCSSSYQSYLETLSGEVLLRAVGTQDPPTYVANTIIGSSFSNNSADASGGAMLLFES